MSTKKAKEPLHQSEALLPLIFFFYRAGYLPRSKSYPISNRVIIALFLLSTPPSVLSVARNTLALPLAE
jgi:hypothetical protein